MDASPTPIKKEYPPLLTTQQAAELCGLNEWTLLRLRQRGGGPPFCQPSPRVLRYRFDAVMEWWKQFEKQRS